MTAVRGDTYHAAGPLGKARYFLGSDRQTLRDLLTTQARRFEKKIFLEFEDQRHSYGAIDDTTDRIASGLHRLGLRPGDKVALLLSNRPEFIFFFLGAPKVGMIPVPIDPFLGPEEILFAIERSEATAVVAESRFAQRIRLQGRAPKVRYWISVDDDSAEFYYQKIVSGRVLGFWPDLDPEDACAILFTRGTVGVRKAVVLSHRNFVSNCSQLIQPLRIDDSDRFYCCLPLTSALAQVFLVLTSWAAGATCILRPNFSARALLKDMGQLGITVLAGVPQTYEALADLTDSSLYDLSALRLVLCHNGPVTPGSLGQFEARYDALVVESYGMVEATCIICANPYTGVRKPGSVGLPLPGQECRIVSADGRVMAPGQIGEIVVRGANVMKGYYNDPAASARALQQGWLSTGDMGYVDGDGYYHLTARKEPERS